MTRAQFVLLALLLFAGLGSAFVIADLWPSAVLPLGPVLALAFLLALTSAGLALVLWRQKQDAPSPENRWRDLWQAGLEMAAAPDYAQAVRTLVDRARLLSGADAAAFCAWSELDQWWQLQGASGAREAFHAALPRQLRPEHAIECPIVRLGYRDSHLDAVVMNEGRVLGCMCLASRGDREFTADEREWLAGLARQAGTAIENMRRMEAAGQHAVTTERERLARELHDTLAQLLGFVTFKTQAAREYLRQGEQGQADEQLGQLLSISRSLYDDTRELILGLSNGAGPDRALLPAIREYAVRFSELAGVATRVECDGMENQRFAPTIEVQLMRVVQEALSNVRKHAHAQHAIIRFTRDADCLEMGVEDDGVGFALAAPSSGSRYGLQSMRERVASLGGVLSIASAPDQGTRIVARVPLVYRQASSGEAASNASDAGRLDDPITIQTAELQD